MNIHEKINKKAGIVFTNEPQIKISELMPFDIAVENYMQLIEESEDLQLSEHYRVCNTIVNTNHPFRKTMSFAFGIDPTNDCLIRHHCYQYKVRNTDKSKLLEIAKTENNHFYRMCFENIEYFGLEKNTNHYWGK